MRAVRINTSTYVKFMLCSVLAFFFVCTALVSDSSALNLTSDVTIKAHSAQSTITPLSWNNNFDGYCNGLSSTATMEIGCFKGGLIEFNHNIPYITYVNGDIIRLGYNLSIFNESSANHSTFGGLRYLENLNIYHLTDEISQLNDETGVIYSYFYVGQTYYINNLHLGAQVGGFSFFLQSPSTSSNKSKLLVQDVVVFSLKGVSDYSSALTSVNSNLSSINSKINSTNSKLDTVNNNLEDLRDAQEQANEDANDRYEDEKDTISQNGDDAVDSWDDAQSDLSFQAPTFLFNWLWSLGSVDSCVDISVLASLIHSPTNQYCTWYSTSIRSIVSPIINIFIICLLSGFIFSWLKKGGV